MHSFKKIWAEIICLWKKIKELEQNEGSNDGIQSIKEGGNISIDSSDPKNPIISALGVPSTRSITINGVTQDLSANRTWNVTSEWSQTDW